MRTLTLLVLLAGLLLTGGCDNAGVDRVTSITSAGGLVGFVFIDANATRRADSDDEGAESLILALVLSGTTDTVTTAVTDPAGVFLFPNVPVGRYTLVLPPAAFAGSMKVVYRNPPGEAVADGLDTELPPIPPITISRADTTSMIIGIGHSRVAPAEARTADPGRTIFVRGAALTTINEFGEASLYVRGAGTALRIIRMLPGPVAVGDSVHVVGQMSTRAGQPVLADGRAFIIATGSGPEPVNLSASEARTAGGGIHDADLVGIDGVTVGDTTRVAGRFRITSDDAEAPLQAMIHPDGSYDFSLFGPGAVLNVTGVLVPDSVSGVWQVWPRSGNDVVVVTPAPTGPPTP